MAGDSNLRPIGSQADPLATHVIAVGISRYDIGNIFTLPKAAEHAVQFAEWVRLSGVKPENIHLFLSHENVAAFDARLAAAGISALAATSPIVNEFIDKKLKTFSGDLLYFFWSGHGSISENQDRILFFGDMTQQDHPVLDLNHLLMRLRSEPFSRFRYQLAYIDACANRFEELRLKTTAGIYRPGYGKLLAGVQQVFFLAADSGQEATAGKFSELILDALKREYDANQAWPPDHDAIVNVVRPKFEGPYQRPVQIAWSTTAGDETVEEVSGDLPASDYVNDIAIGAGYPVRFLRKLVARAPAFTRDGSESRRDVLYEKLSHQVQESVRTARQNPEVDLLRLIASAFGSNQTATLENEIDDVAFKAELDRLRLLRDAAALLQKLTNFTELRKDYLAAISPLACSPQRLNASSVFSMLDELTQVRSDDQPYSFLWRFLTRVVLRLGMAGKEINTFIEGRAPKLFIDEIRGTIQSEQRFLLSIAIAPGFGEEPAPSAVEARLLIARTVTLVHAYPSQDVADWSDARAKVNQIVLDARKVVIDHYGKDEDALEIEFLMPEGFFCEAPDQFKLALRPPVELGRVHSVVVRWRARMLERSTTRVAPWRDAGKRIDRKATAKVDWMDKAAQEAACSSTSGLLALGFLPRNEMDDLIGAGFPFIAWRRSAPDGGWDEFKKSFDLWVSQHPFDQLPTMLQTIRQKSQDLGAGLTVFWDDPEYASHWMQLEEPKA